MNKILKKLFSLFKSLLFLSNEEVIRNNFPLVVTVNSFDIKSIRENDAVKLKASADINITSNRYFDILINKSVINIRSSEFKDVLKHPPLTIQSPDQFIIPEGKTSSVQLNFEQIISVEHENMLNDPQSSISLQLIHTRKTDVIYTVYMIPLYKETNDENIMLANVIIKEPFGKDYILNIPSSEYVSPGQSDSSKEINNIIKR